MSEPLAIVALPRQADRERLAPPETPLRSRACRDCGYGIAVERLPERCPMCGGTAWLEKNVSGRRS